MPRKSAIAPTKNITSKDPPSRHELMEWLMGSSEELNPELATTQAGQIKQRLEQGGKVKKSDSTILTHAYSVLAHERHWLLGDSIGIEQWRIGMIDLAQQIQQEYSCTTNSEIGLASLAASAYYRSLRCAGRLDALMLSGVIAESNSLIAILSKEIDRANRQYLSIIETLRNRREPALNVKIQTRSAFFGENQTFNTTSPQPYGNNGEH